MFPAPSAPSLESAVNQVSIMPRGYVDTKQALCGLLEGNKSCRSLGDERSIGLSVEDLCAL